MVIFMFLKFGMVKQFKILHTALDVTMQQYHSSVKVFENIKILPVLICIFIKM